MARTVIPIQTIAAYGGADVDVTFTSADAANDHEFVNSGRCMLLIKNDDASGKQVDIQLNGSDRTFEETGPKSHTVAAGDIGVAGPFKQDAFNQTGDSDNGMVLFDITADTSLSFAVVEWTNH